VTKRLGEELKKLRKDRGLTQQALADMCDVRQSYIGNLEAGRNSFRTASPFAALLSKALDVPLSHWSAFTSDGHIAATAEVPLLGAVAAGPVAVDSSNDVATEVEMLNFSKRYPANAFALRVRGHSVSQFGVMDDDLIVIRPASEPVEGALIVVRQDGSHTLKGYSDGLVISYADDAPPRVFQLLDGAEIVGILIDTIGPRFVTPPKKMRKKRAR
jgi:repressor LexA